MELNINGKKTTPRLDFGALKIYNKITDTNFAKMKDIDLNDDETVSNLFLAMAKRGNPKITAEDLDCMSPAQLPLFSQELESQLNEFSDEPKDDTPNPESPQN